jgi:methionyl-tRNA formyltransferase
VRIAVAATPDVAIPTLNALLVSEHELVSVITRADAPAGRGRELQASPVAQWAKTRNLLTYKPESASLISELVKDLDLVITIGYGFILPESILQVPRHGFINLHFSLLPRWRGAAPVQRAIESGDIATGVTVFKLDKGMDTGPIYVTEQIPLSPDVNSGELLLTLAKLGVGPVLQTLDLIKAGTEPKVQSEVGATRAEKLSKEEGHIDWNCDAIAIQRKVNAFNPNPGAWSQFRGQNLKLNKVRMTDQLLAPGAIQTSNKGVFVGTSTTAIELLDVTPSGKSTLAASAWANGARITSTDVLN